MPKTFIVVFTQPANVVDLYFYVFFWVSLGPYFATYYSPAHEFDLSCVYSPCMDNAFVYCIHIISKYTLLLSLIVNSTLDLYCETNFILGLYCEIYF